MTKKSDESWMKNLGAAQLGVADVSQDLLGNQMPVVVKSDATKDPGTSLEGQ